MIGVRTPKLKIFSGNESRFFFVPTQNLSFYLSIVLRSVLFCSIILFIDYLVPLGTNPWILNLAAIFGILGGSLFAFSRLRGSGYVAFLLLLYLAFDLTTKAVSLLPSSAKSSVFLAHSLSLHGNLLLLCFTTAGLSTWLFWYYRHTITLEILLLSGTIVYFFSGHRNFRFDTPKLVNTLAWNFGLGNLSMLIVLGALASLFLVLYLFISTLPSRPFASPTKQSQHRFAPRALGGFFMLLCVVGLVIGVSQQVHNHYSSVVLTRTANGVGQEKEEGLSPLGFHSALGTSNQPAAIVRLEGDYAENPFLPMLYLREAALSQFQGQEIVKAAPAYDIDTSFGGPFDSYLGNEDVELLQRTPVIQSIYLLTKHENAFAIDYPISITQLKNPSPNRFQATFKAYSMAPAFPLEDLLTIEVGDSRWSPDERQLYLETHPDPRYAELAAKITTNHLRPAEKAFAMVQYLNANAIYTLSPNHDTPPGEDPVASFLFGDMRGYCVHFAHATVYMLRSLGIPSRIGTGYLTDLSQSKDGHILLRMADRHAWAEIYFEGKGWIPFDTQPTQVESHAVTDVDMSLLEELMDLLGPSEEVLPEETLENEENVYEEARVYIPSLQDIALVALALLLLILLGNSFLYLSWLLPSSLHRKLFRLHRMCLTTLFNLGYRRIPGETRHEFQERIGQELQGKLLVSTDMINTVKYRPNSPLKASQLKEITVKELKTLSVIPPLKRLLSFLNPSALFSWLFRMSSFVFLIAVVNGHLPSSASADIQDPYDPFDFSLDIRVDEEEDKLKSAQELIDEAQILFIDERPLDARTKLLRALAKEPESFEAHKLLAGYYLVHVGHFRLALKYIKQAEKLFYEDNGSVPYSDHLLKSQHAHILHLLSQIRLNLDNYQGALDTLNQYASLGYYQDWYPGSRAWILMKLGKIEEAIKTARLGLLTRAEMGRTLNILGILLSVNGEREASLKVFKDAIAHELSLGKLGQPATPLNNSGEVYREIFEEDKAERSWLKSVSLPDGCEHVLPSLNLVVLYIEQNRFANAKKAIDGFESCIAQFPLRNGEEHRALVHLARGRIAMHTGFIDEAVEHFEAAIERRQWFGKIGSSQADLESATTISLAQALLRQNSHEKFRLHKTLWAKIDSLKKRVHNRMRVWWLMRRARQIMTEELLALEDIYVRNTDSIIEYPTFGEMLRYFSFSTLEKRIDLEKIDDSRSQAHVYYRAYLAENALQNGLEELGKKYIEQAIQDSRPRYDDGLRLHLLNKKLDLLHEGSSEYQRVAYTIFSLSKAALRNYGHRLPVAIQIEDSIVRSLLQNSTFYPSQSRNLEYIVSHNFEQGKHILTFRSRSGLTKTIRVKGEEINLVINQLADGVFREKL